MSSELAIVVMSCDRYADMWEPFIRCFEQYWPDCPYEKYLITETSKCQNKFFTETFECGAETEWTDRLDYIVTQLEQDHFLILCDDYLLCDRVDNEKMEELVEIAKIHGAGNLRLLPNPAPDNLIIDTVEIGEIFRGGQYRVSTQVGIWSREYLRQFSGMHTSIWGFERMGSAMSVDFDPPVLCTTRHVFPFIDAVHKGKWERDGVRLCERNSIPLSFQQRPIMSNSDYLVKHGKGAIIDVAPKLVTRTINILTKLKRALRS